MSDRLASYIRTWWPLFLGHAAALLVVFLATKFGIHVEGALAFEIVGFAASAILYWVGRQMENADAGWAKALGKFILSLGFTTGQPTYKPAVNSRDDAPVGTR